MEIRSRSLGTRPSSSQFKPPAPTSNPNTSSPPISFKDPMASYTKEEVAQFKKDTRKGFERVYATSSLFVGAGLALIIGAVLLNRQ